MTDTDLPGLSEIGCPQDALEPGEHQVCTAAYTTTEADLVRGSVTDTATAHGTPPGNGTPVISPPSTATATAEVRHPAITVRKTARPSHVSEEGQVIHYKFLVTNTGDVTLTHVHVTDSGLQAVRCPRQTLAPGQHEICTATHRTTTADLRKNRITDTATAHGTPPGTTTPVHSAPSTAKVQVIHRRPFIPVTG